MVTVLRFALVSITHLTLVFYNDLYLLRMLHWRFASDFESLLMVVTNRDIGVSDPFSDMQLFVIFARSLIAHSILQVISFAVLPPVFGSRIVAFSITRFVSSAIGGTSRPMRPTRPASMGRLGGTRRIFSAKCFGTILSYANPGTEKHL